MTYITTVFFSHHVLAYVFNLTMSDTRSLKVYICRGRDKFDGDFFPMRETLSFCRFSRFIVKVSHSRHCVMVYKQRRVNMRARVLHAIREFAPVHQLGTPMCCYISYRGWVLNV